MFGSKSGTFLYSDKSRSRISIMALSKAFDNAIIPTGSLILVTGANGLIGSHVVDQFLAAGYNVRGTVRDNKRCQWMTDFFANRYNKVKFELAEVADFSKPGAFDEAVKGCAGVAHTTNHVDLFPKSPEPTISMAVDTVITALESAKKEPSVKRFVLTSSGWTTSLPKPDVEFTVTEQTWNNHDLDACAQTEPPPQGLQIFAASKTKAEKKAFEWVEENKPHFTFNAVLPDTVFGNILSPKDQGIPSTAGLVQSLFGGENYDYIHFVQPQHFVDVQDTGKLHVALMVDPETTGVRCLGYSAPFNWNDVLGVFRSLYPDRKFVDDMKLGKDLSVVDKKRGSDLLERYYGQQGWTDLKTTIKANVESFV